jgi:TPR repeat protein
MARILVAVLAFFLLALGASPEAHASKRVAFVVGIDAYDNLTDQQQLKKAVNDAQAIGEALAGLGYDVQKADNVGRLDFLRQWQLFLNRLEPGDEAAVFFAGHGVEIDGQNFLLPRDVPRVESGEEEVLKASGLSLASLLDQVRDRHPQVGLYVLDACRDNPFVDGKGRGIGGTRGLARVEPPSGTFIMFSAGAKESALDRLSDNDPNPNSVYTRTLLPRLKASGRITDIARDVRREVRELAASVAHVQTPAYYDEVVGDFCPAGCEAKTAAASPASAPEEKPSAPPAAPSAVPPVETAAVTPQAVQGPVAATRAPILDCDRLAADPNNPDSAVRDRDFEEVDHVKAIPACEEAARLYPQERRFAFQLARSQLFARQFDVARPRLEALSRDGYAIATAYLGIALADSKKGSLDNDAGAQTEAFRLIRQAADAGDAVGAFFLAQFYEEGVGVAKDEAEALRWVRKAADAGSAMAMNVLAAKYAEGKLGLAKDDAEAAAWYRKAADLGSTSSLYRLALIYREGRGVPKDEAEAARLFQQADDRKRPKAMIEVGRSYDYGQGVAEDKAEALRWYRKAADLGDSSGMYYVGLMYRYGEGVAKDSAEAARWYRQAAELGDTSAMTNLAAMYAAGDGVPVDAAEAKRWRDAAKAGSGPESSSSDAAQSTQGATDIAAPTPEKEPAPVAALTLPADAPLPKEVAEIEELAGQYAYGLSGKPVDEQEAGRLYRKVAESAGPRKITEIAGRFEIGSGVSKDHAEAARLYRKAAELGDPEAMVEFGRLLSYGDGVAENDTEAVKWYRKSVDRGDPRGMLYLAMAYRFGEGVKRDMAEAVRWYRKAAELGKTFAMTSLAEMYEKGDGVPQDAAEAERWRKAAASAGN